MIGVVIVTYNRLEKLRKALICFDEQTAKMQYVCVVDNASNDGTSDFLKKWKLEDNGYNKIVISMEQNTGGSGGFYKGIQSAVNLDAEWIWVSDDDAFPERDAIEKALSFINKIKDKNNISAICGSVLNNGTYDLMHRRIIRKEFYRIKQEVCPPPRYTRECFELNAFSYVGAILNKDKVVAVGLPQKDYFIWFDDTEHSLRLSKVGKILCVPSIRVNHDVIANDNGISWKSYYGIRNQLDMYRKHFPCYVFWIAVLKWKLRLFFRKMRKRKIIESFLFDEAVNDAINKRFGLHKVYKPGWKL